MIFNILLCIFTLSSEHCYENKTITSVTLSPHLAELVYSAGGGDSLLAVSAYSDYPEEVKSLPVIGDAFRLNYEQIKLLKPDVIFYWKSGTAQQVIDQLHSLEFMLQEIDIENLNDIPTAINQIAQTLNTKPNILAQSYLAEINQLKSTSSKKQSALIQLSEKPIYTVDASHWMSEIISLCGLENIYESLPNHSAAVTLESIVLAKPEIILTTGTIENNPLMQQPNIPAIQSNNIIALNPDHFSRPTLRTILAAKSLCAKLHSFDIKK